MANPVLSNLVIRAGVTDATLTWSSDIPSDTAVTYGVVGQGSQGVIRNSSYVTSHSLVVGNSPTLLPATSYFFNVDGASEIGDPSNTLIGTGTTWTTISPAKVDQSTMTVTFDHGSSGTAVGVNYGSTSSYGSFATGTFVSGTSYISTLDVTGFDQSVNFQAKVDAELSSNQTYIVPMPQVLSYTTAVDRSTGAISFDLTYVSGPRNTFCFMWRYFEGDAISPLTYSEPFTSDSGSHIIVTFNPYEQTGSVLPTDGMIAFNVILDPSSGACDALVYTTPYDFQFPDGYPKAAPNPELNRDFYQDALSTAVASDDSGRLDAGSSSSTVQGSTQPAIKTSPGYINPDTFIDNILK